MENIFIAGKIENMLMMAKQVAMQK